VDLLTRLNKNAKCFRGEKWSQQKVKSMLWELFIDHGCTAWLKIKSLVMLYS
jgi:hypothetical protein